MPLIMGGGLSNKLKPRLSENLRARNQASKSGTLIIVNTLIKIPIRITKIKVIKTIFFLIWIKSFLPFFELP